MGDLPGHPFRGNQWGAGGVSVSRGDWKVREDQPPYSQWTGRLSKKSSASVKEFDKAFEFVKQTYGHLLGAIDIEYGGLKNQGRHAEFVPSDTRPLVRVAARRTIEPHWLAGSLVHELTHYKQHREGRLKHYSTQKEALEKEADDAEARAQEEFKKWRQR